jgi:hypothetical protein
MSEYQGALNIQDEDYSYYKLGRKLDPWDTEPKTGKLIEHNRPPREWGVLIHPSEMRQVLFVGNGKLITTSGDQIQDYHLKNWIDLSIESFAQQIQFDIYPRLFRHRPLPSQAPRTIEPYAEWDDLYDYNPSEANYFFVKLRKKPIAKLHKWLLSFPYTGNQYIDLSKQAMPRYWQGILKAVFVRVPWSNIAPVNMGINAWRGLMHGYAQLPGGYQIDYTTGFEHASHVPAELKEQIMKLVTINVMSAYGDGIIGGMANYSTSVSVLSESVGTTMSASIDGADTVLVRHNKGIPFDIPIEEFYEKFKGRYTQFETIAVNPNDSNEIAWKPVLDAVLHDATNKECFHVKTFGSEKAIGITEDHSLFTVNSNRLVELKGINIVPTFSSVAVLQESTNYIQNALVSEKVSYRPKENKVYDLSVKDWENFLVNRYYVAHNTSAFYGARIKQLTDEIQVWWKQRRSAYGGVTMTSI